MSRDFLNGIKSGAIQTWNQHSVLPSVVGAQAALESGWGTSSLSRPPYNNIFGIKSSSDWGGRTVVMPTREWVSGGWITINATFRAYDDAGHSVRDHGAFFTNTPWRTENYKHVVGERDYKKACRALQAAGYATDQQYSSKLINIIETWGLKSWDTEALSGSSSPSLPPVTNPVPKEVGGPVTNVAIRDNKNLRYDIISDEHARHAFDQIRAITPNSGFITRTGRDMEEIISKAEEYVNADNLRNLVVIVAGTHGGVTNFQVDRLMTVLGGSRKVLFVDTASEVEHIDRVQAEYAHASTRYSNAYHGSWRNHSKSMMASWYSKDENGKYMHMTDTGKQAFAEWLAESVYEVETGDFSGRSAKTQESERVNIKSMELKPDGTLTYKAYALQQDGSIKETQISKNIGIKGLHSPLGDDSIYNAEANERWGFGSSVNTSNWLEAKLVLDDETNAEKLMTTGARELIRRAEPHMQWTVSLLDIDPNISVGDTGVFIDHEWNPPLYIEARVLGLTTSRTNKALNQAIIGNVEELYPQENSQIVALQRQLENTRDDLRREWIEGQPLRAEITATAGILLDPPGEEFADMDSTQLQVRVFQGDVDITDRFNSFEWQRISTDGEADEDYNSTLDQIQTGNFLTVYAGDVVGQSSTFICQVYNKSGDYVISAGAVVNLKEPGKSAYEIAVENGFEGSLSDWFEYLKGEDGLNGSPGMDGVSSYTHIAWADSPMGDGFSPVYIEGKAWMGIYHDDTEASSQNHNDYEWMRVKGDDGKTAFELALEHGFTGSEEDWLESLKGEDGKGEPGEPGIDGRTPYFHVAWADDELGTGFTTEHVIGKAWMGTVTTFDIDDPADWWVYDWQLVKGEDGEDGQDGQDGADGTDGEDGSDATANNLLINSRRMIENNTYLVASYLMTEELIEGEFYTLTIKATKPASQDLLVYQNNSQVNKGTMTARGNGFYALTFQASTPTAGHERVLRIYQTPQSTLGTVSIEWAMLTRSTVSATAWFPSVEDIYTELDNKANDIDLTNVIEILSTNTEKVQSLDTDLTVTKNNALITHTAEYINTIERLVGSETDHEARMVLIEQVAEQIETYFKFDDAFTIGRSNSQTRLRMTNEEIQFLDGETKGTYITGNTMVSQNISIQDSLQFPNHSLETDGDLTIFRYVGN